MKDNRLFKTGTGDFERAAWDGHNGSGYMPLNDKVLVLIDAAAAKTTGGIIVPDEISERNTMGAMTGVIVAVGPAAFFWNTDRTLRWEGEKPQPGDRIYIEKYSGQYLAGVDGKFYRLLDDKCVAAVEVKATAKKVAA